MALRSALQTARLSSAFLRQPSCSFKASCMRRIFATHFASGAAFEPNTPLRFFAHGPHCHASQTAASPTQSRGGSCAHLSARSQTHTPAKETSEADTVSSHAHRAENPCAPCSAVKGSAECHALQCWSCAHFLEKSQVFCMKCSRIQPPQDMTYFEMFGMNAKFDVSVEQLQKKYWQLSKQVHPDRFNRGSEEEQTFSASQTMNLNHAYNTLKQPHLRAIYLLGLRGITVSESESITDEEFLMEIMEIREAVDSAENVEELHQLKQDNEERIGSCLLRLDTFFRQENWAAAKRILHPLQYYMKIRETITEKLPM